MTRSEIQQLFADKLLGNPIHIHLEDREYPTYRKRDVQDLLLDFNVKEWIAETHDCDDQADDMRQYLRKNGVRVGYYKTPDHMMLVFTDGEKLKVIDPGTKWITEPLDDVQYVAWW